jgi:hypothetical protein
VKVLVKREPNDIWHFFRFKKIFLSGYIYIYIYMLGYSRNQTHTNLHGSATCLLHGATGLY